jgi:hypothetical protein
MGLLWPPMRPPALPPRASPCPHSKTVHASTNQAIPPLFPVHAGQRARAGPSTAQKERLVTRARGLEEVRSACAGRQAAVTPQCTASWSCARACSELPKTGSQASEHLAGPWRDAQKPETQSQPTAYYRPGGMQMASCTHAQAAPTHVHGARTCMSAQSCDTIS